MELEEPHFSETTINYTQKFTISRNLPTQLSLRKKEEEQQDRVMAIKRHESAVLYATFYRRDSTKLSKNFHKIF